MSAESAALPAAKARRRVVSWLLAAALCYGAAVGAQFGADRARSADPAGDVLYLPNEKLLTHFTAGLSSVIADLLWLRCIQYTAIENRGRRVFEWLEQMVFTTVRLDPYFKDAYRYGAIFLSALRADADSSLELLHLGIPYAPRSWELPFEAAMVQLQNRRNEPDSRFKAAQYAAMSVATGYAPGLVIDLAAKLQSEYDLGDIEAGMWENMLNSDDRLMRELAQRKLHEVVIRRNLNTLEEWVEKFREGAGRDPESLEELLRAGGIDSPPPDPLGGRYFLGPDGTPLNTSLLDGDKDRRVASLRRQIDAYREKHGAWPESLEDLITAGQLRMLPVHPYPGESWRYTPETGGVE